HDHRAAESLRRLSSAGSRKRDAETARREAKSMAAVARERDGDRGLLIPVGETALEFHHLKDGTPPAPIAAPPVASHHTTTGIEVSVLHLLFLQSGIALSKVIRSWASKTFMTGW
ncbi:hypothetical protein B296_00031079, partial [Ensete ventricosum]